MEFDIQTRHDLGGHIVITDYSKEYELYIKEDSEYDFAIDKFKYSESATLDVVMKVNTGEIKLLDVLLDEHDKDLEETTFDVLLDGYYAINHFVLPTYKWLLNRDPQFLDNFSRIYFIDLDKIWKMYKVEKDGILQWNPEVEEVSIRELLETNLEGTTIQKCKVSIFYTGFLTECYINVAKRLFEKLMHGCKPNCKPKDIDEDTYARDFIWMTLNVIDYLIHFELYLEAQRILEEINYCGGFCLQINEQLSTCATPVRSRCGCNKN